MTKGGRITANSISRIERELEQDVLEGRHISLIGESGTGKTTLLRKVADKNLQVDGKLTKTIYLDMQTIKSSNEFYAAVADLLGLDNSLKGYFLARAIRSMPYTSIILLIDESGLLFTDEVCSVCSWLRAMTDNRKFVLVLASLVNLTEIEQQTKLTSPLNNLFTSIELT